MKRTNFYNARMFRRGDLLMRLCLHQLRPIPASPVTSQTSVVLGLRGSGGTSPPPAPPLCLTSLSSPVPSSPLTSLPHTHWLDRYVIYHHHPPPHHPLFDSWWGINNSNITCSLFFFLFFFLSFCTSSGLRFCALSLSPFLPSSFLLYFLSSFFASFLILLSFPTFLSISLFLLFLLPFSLHLSSPLLSSSLRCQCQVVWTPLPMVLLSPSSSRRVSTAMPHSQATTRWCSIATRIPVSKEMAPSGLGGLWRFQNLLWMWVETRFYCVLFIWFQ